MAGRTAGVMMVDDRITPYGSHHGSQGVATAMLTRLLPHELPRDLPRRTLLGIGASLLTIAVLTVGMLPLRDHLSIATTALVLVVPVVVGVAMGGFTAGLVSVVAGFLVYDFFFIPPYWTFVVGAAENWVALAVYAIIMIPIARLCASMFTAREQALHRGVQLRRLLEVSGQLIEDRPLPELLSAIVTTLREVVDARQVVLLLPEDADLEIVASAGDPLTPEDQARLRPLLGRRLDEDPPVMSTRGSQPFGLALAAAGRPVGLLVVSGAKVAGAQREPLHLFANQAALAIERARLREQAMRAQVTEELARLARMLVAAVSHDLRTPLASIKAASSVLVDEQLTAQIEQSEKHDLAALIDDQADRLAGLVTNLLDMGRVQAGVLEPRRSVTTVSEVIAGAVAGLPQPARAPEIHVPADLPPVDLDAVLITRVLVNLLDNAYRHAPKDTPVVIAAALCEPGVVTISVTDQGPGISPERRDDVFGFYVRRSNDSGTGLGLAIAKTFLDAHGQRIWIETAPGGGARFCFTVPVADVRDS